MAVGVLSMFIASSTAAQWRLQTPVDVPSSYSISIRVKSNFCRSMPQYLQLGDCLTSSCATAVIANIPNTTANANAAATFFLFICPSLNEK